MLFCLCMGGLAASPLPGPSAQPAAALPPTTSVASTTAAAADLPASADSNHTNFDDDFDVEDTYFDDLSQDVEVVAVDLDGPSIMPSVDLSSSPVKRMKALPSSAARGGGGGGSGGRGGVNPSSSGGGDSGSLARGINGWLCRVVSVGALAHVCECVSERMSE
jgi:uncharacterized membrane protein YgcG